MFVCLEPAAKYKLVLRQVLLFCANSLFGAVGAGSTWGLLGSLRKMPKNPDLSITAREEINMQEQFAPA